MIKINKRGNFRIRLAFKQYFLFFSYIYRMKEYEREKRLLLRKQRIEKKQGSELHA